MAFGQQSGPPASARQVRELLTLLHDAGHTDFRDARGPMGFTQRQAAGKFTSTEAVAFIEALQNDGPQDVGPVHEGPDRQPVTPPPPAVRTGVPKTMRHIPADQLAAELRRRGWTVTEPPVGQPTR